MDISLCFLWLGLYLWIRPGVSFRLSCSQLAENVALIETHVLTAASWTSKRDVAARAEKRVEEETRRSQCRDLDPWVGNGDSPRITKLTTRLPLSWTANVPQSSRCGNLTQRLPPVEGTGELKDLNLTSISRAQEFLHRKEKIVDFLGTLTTSLDLTAPHLPVEAMVWLFISNVVPQL